MDLGTIGGLILGWTVVIVAILMEPRSAGIFLHLPSFLIVFGGTFGATMAYFPLKDIAQLPRLFRIALKDNANDPAEVISSLVRLAEKARREGLLALEDDLHNEEDEFLRKGIQLVVDGTDPDLVRSILEIEISYLEERHQLGQNIFRYMGSVAPAFGMIGTLIGLIQMLTTINNPDAIAGAMGVALITSLYGSLIANVFANPVAGKLAIRSRQEVLLKELMVEGILSLQAGENPRIVEEKLKSFLSPKNRDNLAVQRKEHEQVMSSAS
ncbi:MAG TPA: motility protein A [Firmicutes bacterium]|nr:motility protein A [Bacillota bacterium]